MDILTRSLFTAPSLVGLILLAVSFSLITTTSGTVRAESPPPSQCKVIIALDRSASIGDNWTAMRGQVLNVFSPSPNGLGDRSDISLAFWTFSHVPNASGVNYNAPYHDYVAASDPGAYNAFNDSLPTNPDDILGGQTNYEQGFGFNQGTANNKDGISSIRSQATVVVFLTDGAPNYPGGLDNNPQAIAAGNTARNSYTSSVPVIGGYVSPDPDSNYVPLSLYQTINGNSDTSATNIGPLDFNSLTDFLVKRIPAACNIQQSNYSVAPVANVDSSSAKSGDQIHFSYSGNNTTSDGSSGKTDWNIFDITIAPGFKGSAPCTGGNSYCDGVTNCTQIMAMIGNQGTCDQVPPGGRGTCGSAPSTDPGSGNHTFTPGPNAFYNPPRCQTVGDLPLGTRVCSMLALQKPTSSGVAGRMSGAACVVIGKTPLVQIHGGDVRVGRHFNGDTTPAADAGVYTSRFKISNDPSLIPNGRTYGSWVEYGVLAPGPIQKIASLSGYSGPNVPNGGTDDSLSSTSDCDTNNNSHINKLTFANTNANPQRASECGYLSESPGLIPDVVSNLVSRTPISPSPYNTPTPLKLDGSSQVGLYKNDTSNATFEIGASTISKGKVFVVYVPHGTVTISGNIQYSNDSYTSSTDIPQLVIIAKNIKINEGVQRVDAWLVANGDNTGGGAIDTCAGYAPPLSSKVCNLPLLINGPIMARELNLWRTTVDLSDPACKVTGALSDCNNVGDPAEIINLPGSAILWAKGYGSRAVKAQTTYTTELPPYF